MISQESEKEKDCKLVWKPVDSETNGSPKLRSDFVGSFRDIKIRPVEILKTQNTHYVINQEKQNTPIFENVSCRIQKTSPSLSSLFT